MSGLEQTDQARLLMARQWHPGFGQLLPQARRLGLLVNRVRTALAVAVDDAFSRDKDLAPLEVTSAQFLILVNLHIGDAESAGDLCRILSYDRGAMSRMIDRLEAKGLVRRVRRPGERRTIHLEVTREGEALLPKMRVGAVAVLNRFLRSSWWCRSEFLERSP